MGEPHLGDASSPRWVKSAPPLFLGLNWPEEECTSRKQNHLLSRGNRSLGRRKCLAGTPLKWKPIGAEKRLESGNFVIFHLLPLSHYPIKITISSDTCLESRIPDVVASIANFAICMQNLNMNSRVVIGNGYETAKTPFQSDVTHFQRKELDVLLSVYGRLVAHTVMRDYAIDHLKDVAIFSFFRNSSEVPLYRLEKRPALSQKQGTYALLSANGQILKRGHDLRLVLKPLERKLLKLVEE